MFTNDEVYQHPIYALILSVIVIIIVIQSSIQQRKFQKTKLILSFLNTFLILALWFTSNSFDDSIFKIIFNSVMVFEYVLFGILIFVISSVYLQKMRYFNNFIDSFKNTTFNVFFVTDKKDRIQEMSESLLLELGYRKEEVIGKKFFDVVSSRIRFFRLDDTQTDNDSLRNYYATYGLNANPNDEIKRELYFYNRDGQTVILNLLEKPIFYNGKYKGRMNIGQKKDNNELLATEKELKHQNDSLLSIQNKFITTLELTTEGVFFYEIDKEYIWFNDNLFKLLNLQQNTLSVVDFHTSIHPDDFGVYKSTIDKLTPDSPNYNLSYRFKSGYNYQYITERGKRIFEDTNNPTIIGYVTKYENSYFAKTNYSHLDELKSYDDLVTDVNLLRNNNINFDLITLRTTNLPAINETHSRKIGDMLLAAYIKEISSTFLTESANIYRVTGTDFIFTITDGRKMELLRRCLESSNEVLNFKMQYGSTSVILEINMGIAQSYNDGNDSQTLITNSKKALVVSLNNKYSTNYAFYKDIAHD